MQDSKKELKEKLVDKVVLDIWQDRYNCEGYIFELLKESLSKRTKKELKQILYGE